MTLAGWENDHMIGIMRFKGEDKKFFMVESTTGPCGPFEIVNEIAIPGPATSFHSPHIFRYKSPPSWMYEYWVTFILPGLPKTNKCMLVGFPDLAAVKDGDGNGEREIWRDLGDEFWKLPLGTVTDNLATETVLHGTFPRAEGLTSYGSVVGLYRVYIYKMSENTIWLRGSSWATAPQKRRYPLKWNVTVNIDSEVVGREIHDIHPDKYEYRISGTRDWAIVSAL